MLSNRAFVLSSAALVAVLILVLSIGGRPGGDGGDSDGSVEVQSPQVPSDAPRVISVKDYVASLTPGERSCFDRAAGVEEAAALERGEATVTDEQLQALNVCVNPTLPNPTGVVQ